MPNKTRFTGNLVSDNNIFSDIVNDRVGIGTTVPSAKLDVAGNVNVSEVLTATTFVGNLTGTATTATSVVGGIGSITQLQVTGISTFSNGPVFIGAATSTGTASQPLQVTGGAYVSGNLGIGTTNPIQPFQVGAAGTNVVVIDSIGEIGIGTTSPQQKLHVVGNALVSGNLGIGTTNPTSTLHVVGDVRAGANSSQGVILTSPNGTKYRLIVSDLGVPSTVLVV